MLKHHFNNLNIGRNINRAYVQRNKDEFEAELKKIQQSITYLGKRSEVSKIIQSNGYITNEYVYRFRTGKSDDEGLYLLVYSSVNKDTNNTRDCGEDAVRIVYVYTDKTYGYIYEKVKKCLRIQTLFKNVEYSLQAYLDKLFSQNRDDFRPQMPE